MSPWFVIGWFYFVLISSIPGILKRTEAHFIKFTGLIVYIISFELLGRISRASPFIPYETGKYLLIVLLISGILLGYRNGKLGWVMLIFLIPGIIIDESGLVGFKNQVANVFGPISIAFVVIYFKNQSVSREEFKSLLKLLILPIISVLSFVIIKNPDFNDEEFNLAGGYLMSGGWGTNQVATALGLGALVVYIFWRNNWNLSGSRWLDILVFLLFTIRGLLTFSRGGMIGGFLAIVLLLFYETWGKRTSLGATRLIKNLIKVIPIVVLFVIVFQYADRATGGNLALRYQGETPGTLAGTKEKNLNTFTSNRVAVFKDDLSLWREYPIFGVGVGASSNLREHTYRVAAHVELSRLLSEHGILGLIYFAILIALGIKVLRQASMDPWGPMLLSLFVLALFTTFHSAMRTFITPLLIGLSMLSITEHTEEEPAG